MNISIRIVDASRGWRWIAEGMLIFRKAPLQWLLLVAILFIGSRVLLAIPLVGVIATALMAPSFLAGLSHGAQAVGEGKPLRLGYLASGFLKNAAQLTGIGVVSLLGQLLTASAMMLVGGDAVSTIVGTMSAGSATPETIQAMRTGMPAMMLAVLVGFALSIPLIMAAWFAPLLVFFNDVKTRPALVLSLYACLKNTLPFLLYCVALLVPVVILVPLSLALRQSDFALWLLAPILVPSIYAGYRDLFVTAPAQS